MCLYPPLGTPAARNDDALFPPFPPAIIPKGSSERASTQSSSHLEQLSQ